MLDALLCLEEHRISFVLMQVDPTLTRADRLVGQVLGEVDALPDVFTELEINFFLLRRLLGVRTQVSCFHGINFKLSVCTCAMLYIVDALSPAHQQRQPVMSSFLQSVNVRARLWNVPAGWRKARKGPEVE